jgi:hypothetical protein
MEGGEISDNTGKAGGGVYASVGSRITMTGGIIKNNKAQNSDGTTGGARDGGGVCLVNGAEFTMSGTARITDNTADNGALGGGGGGVMVNAASIVRMAGGASDHHRSAGNGGGVYVQHDGGVFTMTGGLITANEARSTAGGVYTVDNAIFNLDSPAIAGLSGSVRDNTAASAPNVRVGTAPAPGVFNVNGTAWTGGNY